MAVWPAAMIISLFFALLHNISFKNGIIDCFRRSISIGSGSIFFRNSIPVSSPFVCNACNAKWVRLPSKCPAWRSMTIGNSRPTPASEVPNCIALKRPFAACGKLIPTSVQPVLAIASKCPVQS
jgi:hypothetical protein